MQNKMDELLKKHAWKCAKCDNWVSNATDRDYHDNTMHPNFEDPYVQAWWARGRPGMSPYD